MTAVIDALLNRSSEPRLEAPAPDPKTLAQAFDCAARAPDHALLRPWRYLVVEGDGLKALGELFASTCGPGATEKERNKLLQSPLRAPMVIVGVACHQSHPKVPEIEQTMSAAVGLGYMLLALQSAGFGGMWRTGAMAYHPTVTAGLGLDENELITGFLYAGTVASEKAAVPRPDQASFVQRWPG
jgi:nitroreductase